MRIQTESCCLTPKAISTWLILGKYYGLDYLQFYVLYTFKAIWN